MSKLEFWWDVFLLMLYPVPVLLFYPLFNSEQPIQRIFKDRDITIWYVSLGLGTLSYLIVWLGMLTHYPASKQEWLGRIYPVRLLSLGGIWVTFVLCHTFGILIVLCYIGTGLWVMAAWVKKVFVRAT